MTESVFPALIAGSPGSVDVLSDPPMVPPTVFRTNLGNLFEKRLHNNCDNIVCSLKAGRNGQ